MADVFLCKIVVFILMDKKACLYYYTLRTRLITLDPQIPSFTFPVRVSKYSTGQNKFIVFGPPVHSPAHIVKYERLLFPSNVEKQYKKEKTREK